MHVHILLEKNTKTKFVASARATAWGLRSFGSGGREEQSCLHAARPGPHFLLWLLAAQTIVSVKIQLYKPIAYLAQNGIGHSCYLKLYSILTII